MILLKNNVPRLLCSECFLIKWEEVQFSGGKCFLKALLVFQGASSLTLDAKGRLSVPTRHRDVLNATNAGALTITKHPHGYLMIFPRNAWEEFRKRITDMPASAQWWKRIFLGNAMDVDIDGTGRVLISPELRAGAGISRDTLLLGMGAHFELWDAATYAAQEAEQMMGGMPDVFKDFSF